MTRYQYLVHLQGPIYSETKNRIERHLGHKLGQYLPHNTFLLYATSEVAKRAADLPEVLWVGPYLPENKISADVSSVALDGKVPSLEVSLVPGAFNKQQTISFATKLRDMFPAGAIRTRFAAEDRIIVTIAMGKDFHRVVGLIAEQNEVHFIDIVRNFRLYDTYTQYTVESNIPGSTPLTANGLTGSRYIIGIGDSGIDYDNCFFNDVFNPVPVNTFNEAHRKIVIYDSTSGDVADGSGHGTHVAGVLAGNVQWSDDPDLQNALSQYNGIAPGAKIAFKDLARNTEGSSIVPPADLYHEYLGFFLNHSAVAVCSAWGSSTAASTYTAQDREVDAFVYDHPTFLPIFSAGESGGNGRRSVATPSTAKNALSVGSSKNSLEAELSALPVNDFAATAAKYYDEMCVSNTTTLFEDETFCSQALGVSTPCTDSQSFFCSVFTPTTDGCCKFAYFEERCCTTFWQARIQHTPFAYGPQCVSSFSGRGPTYDGRIKPDIVAPGEVVYGPRASNGAQCADLSDEDSSVSVRSGTSQATAVASGLVLLVKEYFESGFYPTGDPTPGNEMTPSAALLKATLIHSGQAETFVSGANTKNPGEFFPLTTYPDNVQGFGRVQMKESLYFYSTSQSGFQMLVYDDIEISSNETWSTCVFAQDGVKLRATLVWTDPPAALSAGVALVNNLDLLVSDENGTVYHSNQGNEYDALNNVEQVTVVDPNHKQASLHVYVFGTNVPQGPQKFSLIITGSFQKGAACQKSRCPLDCGFNGLCDTSTGRCTCYSPFLGPDCTIQPCANNCSGNGVCTAAGLCECAAGFSGANCEIAPTSSAATGDTIIQEDNSGISEAAFAGSVVAAFVFGAILAFFIGVFAGTKYAEYRRQAAKRKANQILKTRDG